MRTVTKQKSLDEIKSLLARSKSVYLIGCGTCATDCKTGGVEQVLAMSERLTNEGKQVAGWMVIPTACDILTRDAVETESRSIAKADSILVMACGFGVQAVANCIELPVFPALDTLFIGEEQERGVFTEVCRQCGECVIGLTTGICPVTRCSKGLLNGPCGGSKKGKCEIDQTVECAWQIICDRLEKFAMLDTLEQIVPPKDHSKSESGGPRRVERLESVGVQGPAAPALEPAAGMAEEKKAAEAAPTIEIPKRKFPGTLLEERLKAKTGQLEKLNRELDSLNRRLKEQSELRSKFVSMVSHELRAPLAAIQTNLKVVLMGYTAAVNEKQKELIGRAERKCRTTLTIVNDLLDLSRIDADEIVGKMGPLSLPELMKRVVESLQLKVVEKNLKIETRTAAALPFVTADPRSMEQVFTNLISNAIKYSREGSVIAVSFGKSDDRVSVRIEDQGIGIPEDELPKVFDDFYRASNAKEWTPDGTGLGLAIVKRIIEVHGGAIKVESRAGAGTTFTLIIPIAPVVSRAKSTAK
jgi:signal transduction histidine kinase/ferredoxin